MKFSDLDLDRKHQMLVNFEAFKIACAAMSEPSFYYQLLRLVGRKASPEDWATTFGEIAVERVKSMPEDYKTKLFEELDRATEQANKSGESFLLVIEE